VSMLISVPRLLEFAKTFIDAKLFQSNRVMLTKESIQDMYKAICVKITERYIGISYAATPERKSALIFQDEIYYESTDSMLFGNSYFTGRCSISESHSFTPQGSVCMLAAYDIFDRTYSDSDWPDYDDSSKIFMNALVPILRVKTREMFWKPWALRGLLLGWSCQA
jgi:hypothetical protein